MGKEKREEGKKGRGKRLYGKQERRKEGEKGKEGKEGEELK